MKVFLAIVIAAGSALAQPAAQSKPDPASISGLIRDAVTGMPLRMPRLRLTISAIHRSAPVVTVSTNSEGRYEAKGLEGGQFRIRARGPPSSRWSPVQASHENRLRASRSGTEVRRSRPVFPVCDLWNSNRRKRRTCAKCRRVHDRARVRIRCPPLPVQGHKCNR